MARNGDTNGWNEWSNVCNNITLLKNVLNSSWQQYPKNRPTFKEICNQLLKINFKHKKSMAEIIKDLDQNIIDNE